MTKKKTPATCTEWWENYSWKVVSDDELLSVATSLSIKYPRLSKNYLYHLLNKAARYIIFEFESNRCKGQEGQLNFLNILKEIINNQAVFKSENFSLKLEYIGNLSLFYAGDIGTIEWLLEEAVGPSAQKLTKPKNFRDYSLATKEITKTVLILLLRNFYNFLVTHPSLSQTDHTLAEELRATLMGWENSSHQEDMSIRDVGTSYKQVSISPTPGHQASAASSSAEGNYMHQEEQRKKRWFKGLFK